MNKRAKDLFEKATACGLDLSKLTEKYTANFVVDLLKHIKKETKKLKKNADEIPSFYPPKEKFSEISEYIADLKNAGFKIRQWLEDFVDESNGEVISIVRFVFKPLK